MALPYAPQPVENAADTAATVGDWFAAHAGAFTETALRVALIIVIAILLRAVARRVIARVVEHIVEEKEEGADAEGYSGTRRPARVVFDASLLASSQRRRQRAKTIGSVLRSVASITIYGIAFVLVLGELGINLGPIIASAGILGLAIGFGAQSLVRDFLSGMFMLMEDQYGMGDWVDLGDAVGEVEEVGLRVTRVRDLSGVLWYVRNGEIMRVANANQGWGRAILDIPIPYDSDVDRAGELLLETARTLREDPAFKNTVRDDPEFWGVESLTREAIVLRLALVTAPLEQWEVQRELRQRIKARLDAEGMDIPFPQQAIWTRPMPDGRDPAPSPERSPEAVGRPRGIRTGDTGP
ncbi:MAG: mechanosensitive ion channel family protein [Streptosporangiaceae bacterium]